MVVLIGLVCPSKCMVFSFYRQTLTSYADAYISGVWV